MQMLVLGLDGVSPELVEAWSRAGHLPTFRRLMEEGAWGRLTSTVPPLTPPAWVSSVTGVNPGRHNVFDFTRPSEFVPARSTYRHPFIDPTDRQAKAVWEYLNEAGYTAGIITFPFTYPPTEVRGYMLSELWGIENDCLSFPKGLVSDIARAVPQWFSRSPLQGLPEGNNQALEQKLHNDLRTRFEVLHYLLRHQPTDLTFIVFPEIDIAQHHFWHFIDDTHPWHDPLSESPFRHTILRCYQHMDALLAQLLDEMGSDVFLVAYSDHGFGPLAYDVVINTWLIENGFMALKETAPKKRPRININRAALGRIARRLRLVWLTRRIPERVKSRFPMPAGEFDQSERIDWERTRVYFSSLSAQSLMLNLKGREPRGIVSPGREYAQIREDVIAGLRTLQHEESGQPIIADVYCREKVYQGPFVSHAPDIIVRCAPGFQLQHGFDGPLVQSAHRGASPRSGTHAPEGMALLWGPNVAPKTTFHAHIMDIAPTLLHVFGLTTPEMDGRMLREVLSSGDPPVSSPPDNSSPYTPEQERKITEHLRRLGYL